MDTGCRSEGCAQERRHKLFLILCISPLHRSLLADGPVELSYFCGGILSNVMLEWSDDKPNVHFCTKQQMLHKLVRNSVDSD